MADNLYIEMCRKSPVQNGWKPKDGDVILNAERSDATILVGCTHLRAKTEFLEAATWLPRQEDWQDMSFHNGGQFYYVGTFLQWRDSNFEYLNLLPRDSLVEYWTMSWCLFYHKEVLGLIWDFKGEWVGDDDQH